MLKTTTTYKSTPESNLNLKSKLTKQEGVLVALGAFRGVVIGHDQNLQEGFEWVAALSGAF